MMWFGFIFIKFLHNYTLFKISTNSIARGYWMVPVYCAVPVLVLVLAWVAGICLWRFEFSICYITFSNFPLNLPRVVLEQEKGFRTIYENRLETSL